MSLTRVSPALFQVSNNITSVTVGGSANTVSLTFDSNGVITGASNNALSVANTQITGLIEAAQIGSANATLVTSGTLPAARLPAGSVLQVVNATYSTTATNSTASYADTGLTATITPKFNTSKILVILSQNGVSGASSVTGVNLQLLRGATAIVNFANYFAMSPAGAPIGASCNYLDSPATTGATVYKTQFARSTGASFVYTQANTDTSTITLMEIAG